MVAWLVFLYPFPSLQPDPGLKLYFSLASLRKF